MAQRVALLAGCNEPLDYDLRGNVGGFSTAPAAQTATASRPQPDDRGVISYPNYQVAVARRDDTVAAVADRVGINANELARYNGVAPGDKLLSGEVLALPRRVAEPSPATGATITGPIRPGSVDIEQLAGSAIDNAPTTATRPIQTTELTPAKPTAPSAEEPVRHKVKRGETAYTISRLYQVPVKSLAEWNGLGPDFSIREGQFLLIPVAAQGAPTKTAAAAATATSVTPPGVGSPTPTPPSATKPLPDEKVKPAAAPLPMHRNPRSAHRPRSRPAPCRCRCPARSSAITPKAAIDGIDIAAAPGTAVTAATDGTIAAITLDADKVPIIVVRHQDNLLTVYANVTNITVGKGDSVSRGQQIAELRDGDDAYVHFEVRNGFDSVDPTPYLQ